MNRFASLALAVLILAFFALPALAGTKGDYKPEYKLSVVPGPTSGWGLSATYFADLVAQRTEGRIVIKPYFGSQLLAGKQTSEFLMVRNGAIDFALASTINWSPQVKELNLTALPFMLAAEPDRYKALDAIETGASGKMMIEAIEGKGVKIIGWGENGFRELTNSKRPVSAPEDMKDLKIRVVGSPIFIDTFRALGANPVNMNWAEATTGFQQGVVDGQENPVNGICIPVKIWTYHTYLTDWNYIVDPLLLGVNPKVWSSFSPEDQQILLECAQLAERYGKAIARVGMDNGESLAYLQEIGMAPEVADPFAFLAEKGMTVIRLTPEQSKAFHDATAPVRANWIPQIGEGLVQAAEADMASVR
ncbi:DctP family TRAP transporter solute-binding subunit [Desulfovibrio psychrotolerans]|uniref:Exported protein n=1 Tax=Desulfovibrio psychrotolerans TaxID=415242 RepID=A0A7J0BRU2_9BACT|nr:DctP family TRAP transporter solute-binding subunit [Desulfovibrio psychrotolerans]GFM36399.1 exported protein [Desulfovibrio psychrotolerans]